MNILREFNKQLRTCQMSLHVINMVNLFVAVINECSTERERELEKEQLTIYPKVVARGVTCVRGSQ